MVNPQDTRNNRSNSDIKMYATPADCLGLNGIAGEINCFTNP